MNDPEDEILYEVSGDGVASLILNRPEQRNRLTATMVRDLRRGLELARRDSAVGALLREGWRAAAEGRPPRFTGR